MESIEKLSELMRDSFTMEELAEIYACLQAGSERTGCKTMMRLIEKAFHNNMSLLAEAMDEARI